MSDYSANGKPYVTGTIISTNRIKRWYGDKWPLAFSGILLHELGHFYGLPPFRSPDFINWGDKKAKSELDYYHCNNKRCIMEQVNVPGRMDLLEKSEYLQINNPNWYCEYCQEALEENLKKLYQ